MDTLLPGIRAERTPTNRLTVNVLSIPDRTGPAVLFVHGNVSSSLFWQEWYSRRFSVTGARTTLSFPQSSFSMKLTRSPIAI